MAARIAAGISARYPDYRRNNMMAVIDRIIAEQGRLANGRRVTETEMADNVTSLYMRYVEAAMTHDPVANTRSNTAATSTTKGIGGLARRVSDEVTPVIGVENFEMVPNFRAIDIVVDSRYRNPVSYTNSSYFKVAFGTHSDEHTFSYIPLTGGLKGIVSIELIDATFPNLLSSSATDSYYLEPYLLLGIDELTPMNYTSGKHHYFCKIMQESSITSSSHFGRMDATRKGGMKWPISQPRDALTCMTIRILNPNGGTVDFGTDAAAVDIYAATVGGGSSTWTTVTAHGVNTDDKVIISGRKKLRSGATPNNEMLPAFTTQSHRASVSSTTSFTLTSVYGSDPYEVGTGDGMELYVLNVKKQVTLTFRIVYMTDDNKW